MVNMGLEAATTTVFRVMQASLQGRPVCGRSPGPCMLGARPPGNHVRSCRDIVVPDDAVWKKLQQSFFSFVSQVGRQAFPWEGVVGRCLFRVGLEWGLVSKWHRSPPCTTQCRRSIPGHAETT